MGEKVTLRLYDTAEYLRDDEDIAVYLEVALEEDDPAVLAQVLRNIARAKGINRIAEETGIERGVLFEGFRLDAEAPQARALAERLHTLWTPNKK